MLRTSRVQKMVVSIDDPYHILATETGATEILGHNAEDLRKQTIETFEGPETDKALFRVAIQKAAVRESS